MQETKWSVFKNEDEFIRNRLFPGADSSISSNQRSGGLLTWHKDGISNIIEPEANHPQAMWQSSILKGRFLKARIVNVYAPNVSSDRHDLLDDIKTFLESITDDLPLVMAGDWNFVVNPRTDRLNSSLRDNRSAAKLQDLCRQFDLSDAWKHRFGETSGFSWTRSVAGQIRAARLDRLYISNNILHRISNIEITSTSISDHMPVKVTFVSDTAIGPPRFILNKTLLAEQHIDETLDFILSELVYELNQGVEHSLVLWMRYKKRLRQLFRSFGRASALRRRRNQVGAERQLETIKARLSLEVPTAGSNSKGGCS
jgi:exonuclease III